MALSRSKRNSSSLPAPLCTVPTVATTSTQELHSPPSSTPTSALTQQAVCKAFGTTVEISAQKKPASVDIAKFHLSSDVSPDKSEAIFVRDVLFTFHGMDGTYIKFNPSSDRFELDGSLALPGTVRSNVTRVCEMGWCFRRVKQCVRDMMALQSAGRVTQAFCAAVEDELTDYLRMLTALETRTRGEGTGPHGDALPILTRCKAFLTLRRLYVLTHDAQLRMRQLATMCEAAKGLRGGALAGSVHAFTLQGDPEIVVLARRLDSKTVRPLLHMVT